MATKITRFRDIESGEVITTEQLFREYETNVANGNTAPCTFAEYVWNCLTLNNGTLEEI